jgi:hypothetical protein
VLHSAYDKASRRCTQSRAQSAGGRAGQHRPRRVADDRDGRRTAGRAASKSAAARGEFASDEQVRAVWTKHGLWTSATPFRHLPILTQSSITSRPTRRKARVQAIIDLLLLHPGIGTRTDDPTIRRMTALPYPYLIFYEATETEIIIHAVRHAARDPAGMPGAS